MEFIGCDPGKSGAWARLNASGKFVIGNTFELLEYYDLVDNLLGNPRTRLYIELQGPRPFQGAPALWSIAEHYGLLQGLVRGRAECIELVQPAKWQKAIVDTMPARKKEQTTQQYRAVRKKAITAFVCRRWPEAAESLKLAKNQGIADAICIAEYGRRKELGLL